MVVIKRVSEQKELDGIKKLQTANLKSKISLEESSAEGFLTAEYTPEFLRLMHEASPSIIAVDGDEVVGYALVATKAVRAHHALLSDLFDSIDSKSFQGRLLGDVNYVVVGQLCVAKSHRGQGLVQRMYNFYRDELADEFEFLVTDVDEKNPRSLKAHINSGFEVIDTLTYGGSLWHIVLWDWRKTPR